MIYHLSFHFTNFLGNGKGGLVGCGEEIQKFEYLENKRFFDEIEITAIWGKKQTETSFKIL